MKYRPTFGGCLLFSVAAIAAGFEVLGVYEFVSEQQAGRYVYVYCFLAFITPALPAFGDWMWRQKLKRYTPLVALAFLVCLGVIFVSAVQRTGSAADLAQENREKAARAKKLAETNETTARDAYNTAQAAAVKECEVRGKKCQDAEAKATERRTELAIAVAKLQLAPGSQRNPLSGRIPFLTDEQIDALWPMAPPVAATLISLAFFAGWQRTDIREAEEPASAELSASPEVIHTPPKVRIVPFVPRSPRAALPRPTPIEVVPPRPAIPIPQVFGSIRKFAEVCLAAAKGERLEARAAIVRYRNWCKENRLTPADARKCLDELERLYEIEVDGETPYCKDVRLIA